MHNPGYPPPPPPAQPPQPGTYGYQSQPAYAPPPPAQPPQPAPYGYAPQPAYAPPAAPPPPAPAYGYQSQPPNIPGLDLNTVNGEGLNLLPQDPFVGRLRVLSYGDPPRASGPAYTIQLKVEASNQPTMPVGAVFTMLCKKSMNPQKPAGDKTRKVFLTGFLGLQPNAPQDWAKIDADMKARNWDTQPGYVDLSQTPNYSRPMLDKTTRQPLPNQWWASQSWSFAK